MTAQPQIAVRGLSKVFRSSAGDQTAVDRVDLAIEQGEFVAITGHSGSGKTTLLSILGGLLAPTAGAVLVDGEDIYAGTPDSLARYRARKVGFVFQSTGLLPALSVMDNLLLPSLYIPKNDAALMRERARAMLSDVGLQEKADVVPTRLSGGEARRVSLVRALMNKPALLLADEPTGDLDEVMEEQVLGLLERMHRGTGTTLVLVTHSPEIARRAGRRMQMVRGSLRIESR